jgi:hypothetical protein
MTSLAGLASVAAVESHAFAAAPRSATPGSLPIFDPRKMGATGDGKTLDSAAINQAITLCNAGGGGIVYLSPGNYLCGTVILKSNVTPGFDTTPIVGGVAPIGWTNIEHGWVAGAAAPTGSSSLVAVQGDKTTSVLISGCDLREAVKPFEVDNNSSVGAVRPNSISYVHPAARPVQPGPTPRAAGPEQGCKSPCCFYGKERIGEIDLIVVEKPGA